MSIMPLKVTLLGIVIDAPIKFLSSRSCTKSNKLVVSVSENCHLAEMKLNRIDWSNGESDLEIGLPKREICKGCWRESGVSGDARIDMSRAGYPCLFVNHNIYRE